MFMLILLVLELLRAACHSYCTCLQKLLIRLIPATLCVGNLSERASNAPLSFLHRFLPSGNLSSLLPQKDIVFPEGNPFALISWGDVLSGSGKICRL